MTNRTVIGVFERSSDIELLVRDLRDHGFSDDAILILDGGTSPTDGADRSDKHHLTTLFMDRGVPDPEAAYFAESIRQGDRIVTVHTKSAGGAAEAEAILNSHGAIDIEEQLTEWRTRDRSDEANRAASALSAAVRDRAESDEYQTGRTRGSRVFVW